MKIFVLSCATVLFGCTLVNAGTLTCTMRNGTCSGGEVEIFEMQNLTNSHAGLPAASYTNLVCCGGVVGLSNVCSGTFATVLKLSGLTNAHARQGTLADYPSVTNACISVPVGGSVSVGYQAGNCSGFDTTLGSMIGTTNSHVGSGGWLAGTTKICASAHGAGELVVDIVDAGGAAVISPSIVFGPINFLSAFQTTAGVLGSATEKIRVSNSTLNPQWSLTLAASAGPTATWSAGTPKYDFNDPTAGAGDGADADNLGGQMGINATVGTLAGTCATTGVGKGAGNFSETALNSITLLVAGATANIDCYWDLTGVAVSQTIPAEQAASSYSLPMTLTITAN